MRRCASVPHPMQAGPVHAVHAATNPRYRDPYLNDPRRTAPEKLKTFHRTAAARATARFRSMPLLGVKKRGHGEALLSSWSELPDHVRLAIRALLDASVARARAEDRRRRQRWPIRDWACLAGRTSLGRAGAAESRIARAAGGTSWWPSPPRGARGFCPPAAAGEWRRRPCTCSQRSPPPPAPAPRCRQRPSSTARECSAPRLLRKGGTPGKLSPGHKPALTWTQDSPTGYPWESPARGVMRLDRTGHPPRAPDPGA